MHKAWRVVSVRPQILVSNLITTGIRKQALEDQLFPLSNAWYVTKLRHFQNFGLLAAEVFGINDLICYVRETERTIPTRWLSLGALNGNESYF